MLRKKNMRNSSIEQCMRQTLITDKVYKKINYKNTEFLTAIPTTETRI